MLFASGIQIAIWRKQTNSVTKGEFGMTSWRQHRKSATGPLGFVFALSVLLLNACSASQQQPQTPAEPSSQQPTPTVMVPKVSINAVMVDLVDHASHEIWDAAVEKTAPKNDRDWAELEHHATQLAVSGNLIMLGGTGKADTGWVQQIPWKNYSQELSDAGLAARDAVRAKDRGALSRVGDQLVATCEGCHKEFKPDVPSEGIVHHHGESATK